MSQIKNLRNKLNELNNKRDEIIQEQNRIHKKLKNINEEIKKYEKKLKRAENPRKPSVTDHAVIRYLGRVKGIDMDKLREEICSTDKKTLKNLGDGEYPMDDYKIVVKDGTVITIK